jgi:hypothetical protein
VLVRNQNCVDTSEILSDRRKSLDDFPPAQACVNQQSRSAGPDKGRVSRAAARQYADLDDNASLTLPFSCRPRELTPCMPLLFLSL